MALDWICGAVRLSLFSSPETAVSLSVGDWKRLSGGEEPQQEQKGFGKLAFASEISPGHQLSLLGFANRCDCTISPAATPEVPDDLPHIGRWSATLENFREYVERFLVGVRFPVFRMALAPVLIARFEQKVDANKALLSLVKSIKQPHDKLNDILFRINWPVRSAVDGTLINRVTTWSVGQIRLQVIFADAGVASDVSGSYSLRLDIDHNTDSKRADPFDATQVVPIFRELSKLASENADKGEIWSENS